jgi:polyhydroxyalkanoate synthase
MAKQTEDVVENLLSSNPNVDTAQIGELFEMSSVFRAMAEDAMLHPFKVINMEAAWLRKQGKLAFSSTKKLFGGSAESVMKPSKGDHRFKAPEWEEYAFFDYLKQAYLINSELALGFIDALDGKRGYTKEQYEFYARQIISAFSPSNFLFSNPELLKRTLDTKGANLWEGFKQFWSDYKKNPNLLNISMTDFSAFKIGKNVATTPCKVVYENDLMQLLQYSPSTEQVNKTPILIVPPFINKYYILDLTKKKSFVKWLVDQGFTVFMISWINPGAKLKNKGFDNYMLEGPVAAIDAIQKATGEKQINAIAYCVGGTLMASTLAWLEKKGQKPVKSVSYLATLLDFSDPGEIGVFINEKVIANVEKWMDKIGFFDGRAMAFSFSLLRENDLFWSFFINNYLKGEKPDAFDLLFWNSDGTNLPARMHSFYLRNMYLHNKLIEPDGIELAGEKIDLSKIKVPTYFVSTIQDHIAKWKTTYNGMKTQKQKVVRYVLSGSGHIAGIVNPPASNKYGYWTNSDHSGTADEWFEKADQHEGSWWTDWLEWIGSYAGAKVPARQPGEGELPIIEEGPGRYVRCSINEAVKNN